MLFTCITHIHAFSQQVLGSQKTFGGGDYDEFRKLCLTKDGGYIAGGFSYVRQACLLSIGWKSRMSVVVRIISQEQGCPLRSGI